MTVLIITLEVLVIILLLTALFICFDLISSRKRKKPSGIRFKYLNKHYEELKEDFTEFINDSEEIKPKKKKKKGEFIPQKRLFLLEFNGDDTASSVSNLSEEINAILAVSNNSDEVAIKINTPGGTVNGYGHASSQLKRIKDRGMFLTCLVDQVAASGGYMMASVSQRIYASPYAYIGSIGVVSEFPNYHKLLKKYDIEYKTYTAGESKRTVTQFGKVTQEAEKKLIKKLEAIHTQFKEHVLSNRPSVDIKKIATGEHWTANEALEVGLVDYIKTSDDYIMEKLKKFNIYKVYTITHKSLMEKAIDNLTSSLVNNIVKKFNKSQF